VERASAPPLGSRINAASSSCGSGFDQRTPSDEGKAHTHRKTVTAHSILDSRYPSEGDKETGGGRGGVRFKGLKLYTIIRKYYGWVLKDAVCSKN